MAGVRGAFLLNAAERYFALAVQFLMIAVVSRLLTPAEIGVSVIGMGIMTIALSLREFATAEFLIQRKEATRADVRTSFTVLLGLNVLIAAVLLALTSWLAAFYGETRLARFLHVTIAACVLETFALPITGLLRRDMAFGTLAVINITAAAVGAAFTVSLAVLGFSYMSFAWALLATSTTTTVLSLCFRPHPWIFRPALSSWRSVLTFGGYNGATIVLTRVYDALPQLVLGRVLPMSAVGFYNRASMVCGIPDRVFLSGVFSVAFPALAAEARKGRSLQQPYLLGLGYITVVYWPAQVVFALLAQPIVEIVLGQQWLSIVPLVRIMSLAAFFWFPVILTYPVLVAVGAIRDNLISKVISVTVSGTVLCIASVFGIMAMAASQFLTLPFQMFVALHFVRRHVPFRWGELIAAIWKSAVVTAFTAAGPAAYIALAGFRFDLSFGEALVTGCLSAVGWASGIWATKHPILLEGRTVARAIERNVVRKRVIAASLRLLNWWHAAKAG